MLKFAQTKIEETAQLSGLAAYLVRDGILNKTSALHAQQAAQNAQISLTQYLVMTKMLRSEDILNYCAKTFNLPIFNLHKETVISQDINLNTDFIKRYRVIPLHRDTNTLYIGVTDPTDQTCLTALQFHTQLNIQFKLISEEALSLYLKNFVEKPRLEEQLETALASLPLDQHLLSLGNDTEEDDEPIITYVNQLIQEAMSKQVSDVHIEPYLSQYRIRFRRDGLLYEATKIPKHLGTRVISRLKIMAQMNIAEKRLPQDGHINFNDQLFGDLRVSTSPTNLGEKIVLRIFNIHHSLKISDLGMTAQQIDIFETCLQKPHGMILITGPTGSGKTMTLYSALHFLNNLEKNICSIEDPVEINIEGINQMNINATIGLNFATALKHFLRQDPDVIMVGEIRDTETAQAAFQAAQTGHLVLSTLHTNSAIETFARLQDLEIDIKQYASALLLIVAQRLLRLPCQVCKLDSHNQLAQKNCAHCVRGYNGRTGLYEFLMISEKLREAISHTTDIYALKQFLKQEGHKTLLELAQEKLQQDKLFQADITRVVG